MKLRNIFLLISCCFAALSCSMEDDTIMNDVEKDMDNMEEATTEMYTAIDFNLGLNEMTTKSTTITGGNPQLPNYNPDSTELNENYINSSKIFILENDQIIYIIDGGGDMSGEDDKGSPITVKDAYFVTKYRKGRKLTAYAVINASEELFSKVKIGDGVDAIKNHEISDHLTATALVKIGTAEFEMDDTYPRNDSPKYFTYENAKSVVIDVHHIAARLDFKEFTYELDGWSDEKVQVSFEARFENIKTIGNLNKEEVFQTAPNLTVSSFNNKPFTAYSYRSQEKNGGNYVRLYLKVTVTVNDGIDKTKTYERWYDVNGDVEKKDVDHNYIKGGNLYNIAVHWTITPKWADSSIEFYTKDWESHSWNIGDIGDIE